MRISKLVLDNYKSFQLPTTIDFSKGTRDHGQNVFLVGGMNGAGKTSVLEAINICLYGTSRNEIFNAINRRELAKGNCTCALELHLEMDTGEPLIVKRSWAAKPVQATPSADDLEEDMSIVRDGQQVSVTNQETWEEWVYTNIPRGVSQFFFFDGEKIQEMATEEHAERRLKASLESVLGIDVIRQLILDVKQLQMRERRTYTQITDEDIQLKENELDILRRKTGRARDERDRLTQDVADFERELKQRSEEFRRLFGITHEGIEERRQRESRRVDLSTRRADLDNQISSVADEVIPLALVAGFFPKLEAQMLAEARFRDAETVRRMTSRLTDGIVERLFEPNCFCCGRALEAEEIARARDGILEAAASVMPIDDQMGATDVILGVSEAEEARIRERTAEIAGSGTAQLTHLLEQRQQVLTELDDLQASPGVSVADGEDPQLFDELRAELDSYAQQLGRKREELNRADQSILELEGQVEAKEKDLNILYQKHEVSKELTAFLALCDRLTEMLEAYLDGLRATRIKELESRTCEMYRQLASKGDLIDSIRVDPATYLITIEDHHGDEVRKANLAAGEKEVFAISLLWGLAQTSELNLPIVIDTPLARLDSVHRDNIVKNYLPNAGHQVIVLSTDTEVDQQYYRELEPHLQYAARLTFDRYRELTVVEEGYFWKEVQSG